MPRILIAAGYQEDGWYSMRLTCDQLFQSCQSQLHQHQQQIFGKFQPSIGRHPNWMDRRYRYSYLLPRADLIHQIDSSYGDCIPGAKKKSTAALITVHDMAFWRNRHLFNSYFRKRILQGILKADGIIAISNKTARELTQDTGRHADQVIYPGTSPQMFPMSLDDRIPHTIINVGSALPRKGMDRLFYLLHRLPKTYTLVQIGGTLTGDLRNLIDHLQLQDRITFYPKVTLKQLITCYHHSALAIFPARYEGFSLPLIESRLCGTPALVSQTVPACEMLEGDEGTQVFDFSCFDDQEDTPSQDKIINAIKKNSGKAVTLKNRLQFSWQRAASEHIDFYQKFTGSLSKRDKVS